MQPAPSTPPAYSMTFRIPRLSVTLLIATTLLIGCGQEEPAPTPDSSPATDALDVTSAPEGAVSYIISPTDGATVESPFLVQFGLTAMGVAPAAVEVANTGHHHLLIDVEELPSLDEPLPATDNIRHFGGGQTETVLDLPPGTHTLQLILGNPAHIPHDPPVISEKITIEVIE